MYSMVPYQLKHMASFSEIELDSIRSDRIGSIYPWDDLFGPNYSTNE